MRKIFVYALLVLIFSVVNHYAQLSNVVSTGTIYILEPVEDATNTLFDTISALFKNYVTLYNANQENYILKEKLNKLTLQNKILEEKIINSTSFKNHLNLVKCPFVFKDFSNINYIYIKSDNDILHKTVLSQSLNLIGIVDAKIGSLYRVKTVFNNNFIADCFIKNDNNFYRGIYKGSLMSPKTEFLSSQSNIKPNCIVVTSGLLGDIPPNIVIGVIEKVYEERGFYKIATVKIDKSFLNNSFVYVIN